MGLGTETANIGEGHQITAEKCEVQVTVHRDKYL